MSDSQITEVGYGELAGCACALCCAAPAQAVPVEQAATATTQGYDTDALDADQGVDALLTGTKWAVTDLTFSFPDSGDDYSYNFYGEPTTNFEALNEAQKFAARSALDQYAAVSGLTFTELAGAADRDADLTFAESGAVGTAWAYYPASGDWGGDAWFNRTSYNAPTPGNYAWSTFLHEAGHALGLKHGHESSLGGAIPDALDSHEFTVMTYSSYVGSPATSYTNGTWGGPQTLMMLDIAAIQRMYGANFETEAGDTVYTVSTTTGRFFVDGEGQTAPGANVVFRTVWDGGGVDTYDFSNYATDLAVDLAPGGHVDLDVGGLAQRAELGAGRFARGHVFNALQFEGDDRSLIENAIGGAGDDLLLGNAADNMLTGGAGADTLAGLGGADSLTGGGGADVFEWRFAAASTDGDAITDLDFDEGDVLSLSGFATGAFGSLSLVGGVSASGDAAAFASYGDLAALASLSFARFEDLGAGVRLVLQDVADAFIDLLSLDFATLDAASPTPPPAPPDDPDPPEVEGGAAADDGANALTGDAGADTIDGLLGDDTISGLGGADSLIGGGGDDSVDGGDGADVLALGDGDDFGVGGRGADTLRGDAGADTLEGGAWNDLLSGGDHADILFGGDGRDDLRGERGADTLDGGAGADILRGGAWRDSLSGGAGADTLLGGRDADILEGGAWRDRLNGGSGADRLFGDEGDDRLEGGAGVDRLFGGAGADTVLGQNGDDTLFGGDGDDALRGGFGDDKMNGGAGADRFVFAAGEGANVIHDFTGGEDSLRFIGASFSDLAITGAAGGARVAYLDVSVLLLGVASASLDADDFIF